MSKKLSLEEMRQLFIDLIYESDDARTCDGDYFCDINESPETKCRTCAAELVAEYEKKVKAKAIEKFMKLLSDKGNFDVFESEFTISHHDLLTIEKQLKE